MLLTIGHSTRKREVFLALLQAHRVTAIADVRAIPQSRRNPHFSRKNLEADLRNANIAYQHFPALGGHRTPQPDSINTGWRNEAFRGYADHMRTDEFRGGIDDLLAFSSKYLVAIMCAEAQWSDCHRQLIADALIARSVEVRHIMSEHESVAHERTRGARVTGTLVEYPGLF